MAQPSKPTSQRIVDFYEDRKHSKKNKLDRDNGEKDRLNCNFWLILFRLNLRVTVSCDPFIIFNIQILAF
jgi:hypothetical protein